MGKSYPPEFRRKVLDLLDAGRTVTEIATDLGVTGQTIYNWRNQHLIDTGRRDGITSSDHIELVAARKRIAKLEADLAASQRAVELLKEAVPPKGASRRFG
jgi:transposase-like protein